MKKTSFSERLNLAMKERGITQGALAQAVGMAQPSVWKLVTGGAKGSRKTVQIAHALGVRPEWLSSGEGPMRDEGFTEVLENRHPDSEIKPTRLKLGVWEDNVQNDMDEFVEVPLINVKFSAGHGSCEIVDDDTFTLIFRRYSLHNMGVSPGNAKLVRISGDSMHPALNDGDVVGIDISATDIKDGKTYAICHDDMLRVKTLISQPGKIIIRSVNRIDYPDEILERDAFMQSVKIIGRIFWSSHTW